MAYAGENVCVFLTVIPSNFVPPKLIKMTVAASLSNNSPQMRYESLGGTKLLGITVRNTHAFVPAYAMSYSSFVSSPLI
jgi:hypothetical protein